MRGSAFVDALGSIRLMSDAGGAIVESVAYDVFGRPRVMTGAGADGNWLTEDAATYNYSSIGNPYLFTGRRWDSVSGLYYYRFRDYSPDLGRFLQPDPLGTIDGMNLYAYCGNNPVNWIDPWGLWQDHNRLGRLGSGESGSGQFDYNRLDGGWTNPWLPWDTPLHFRDRNSVESDLRDAVRNQDRDAFESLMHQGQDSFSHYDQGYRAPFGHIFDGHGPDDPLLHPDAHQAADQWTREWEDLWELNPSLEDLAERGSEWVKK